MSRPALVPARLGLGLLVGLGAALSFSLPAAAHSTIIDSTPAPGAEIRAAPEVFSVTANEDLSDLTGTGEGFAIEVTNETTGEVVPTGALTIDGPTLSTPGVPLEPGDYVMAYQLVSADGHPVSGEIPFTVLGAVEDPSNEPIDEPTAPDPDQPIDIMPISAPAGPPGWLAGAIAVALLAIGAVAAAASRSRPRR